MRKHLAIGLILALILGMLSVPALAEDGPIEIVVWEMYGPDRGMDKYAEEFNASQDKIHVTDEYLVGHTDLMQKLQVVCANGSTDELPDVILVDMFYSPVVDGLVGGLVDLTQYMDEAGMTDDLYEDMRKFSNVNGRQISIHAYANDLILFYNKAILAEAGLDAENPPKNWEELKEYALAIADDDTYGFHMSAFTDSYYETISWQFETLLWQAGGKAWNDDGTAAFNSDEGKKALNFMLDLLSSGASSMQAPNNGFQLGTVGMILEGTWMTNEFENYLGDDLGATILPGDVQSATNIGGEDWMIIPSDKATEDAAWEYIKYMLSEDVVVSIVSMGGQVPTLKSIANGEKFQDFASQHVGIAASVEALPTGRMRLANAKYAELSTALAGYIEQALFGTISADEALSKAEADWNAILAK